MAGTFTLFVVLPDESVCTLRNLVSGVNIEEIKARLELTAGIPSQIYQLVYPDGERLQDHQRLLMQENIKDGYILKVHILENWESLYNSVTKNNIESVYHDGGVHLKGNMKILPEDSEKLEATVYDRGCVALYMSCYLGLLRMCNKLLSVGVDINGTTQFGRTPVHAAAIKDNLAILKYLVEHGAKINIIDIFGKSPLDMAQAFSSSVCEKAIKIMQLNLRGNHASKSARPKSNASHMLERRSYNKDSLLRPKSLVEERSKVQLKTRPSTHFVSRQSLSTSPKGNRSVAWVSIQDANSKSNQSQKTCSKVNAYYKFQNVRKIETTTDDAITCKPLPLLRKKSCLKFALDDKTTSRSTQTTPLPPKTDISTTPMLFAPPSSRLGGDTVAHDTPSPAIEDENEYRAKSSRSGKLVSFPQKERQDFQGYPDSSRLMKRRINMVSSRGSQEYDKLRESSSTPKRSGVLHDRWADQKRNLDVRVRPEISSSDEDSDDLLDDDSGNGSEAAEAYEAWLKRKDEERKRMPRKVTRPIHNIIKIGSTELGDGRNPSAEHNITAYKDWLDRRLKQSKRVPNHERIRSMKDFMSQKKMLEEKRQKLLMNAISYDEWMDHEYDRRTLIRKILQADFNQLKEMEQESSNKTSSAPQQNNEKWQEEVMKREEIERKRREIKKNYTEEKEKWRNEMIRSTTIVTPNDWLRNKSAQPRPLFRSNSKGATGNDVKRAVDADKAYQDWMKRKHAGDTNDLQRQIQTEKDLIKTYRDRRAAQIATF